jgi:Helix-turn-helix domain
MTDGQAGACRMNDGHLLRLSDAAHVAHLSERTLRRALHDSQHPLRAHRFGRALRIAPADLVAWIRAHAALPTLPEPVLGQFSPTAQELLQDLLGTAAPTTSPAVGSNGPAPAAGAPENAVKAGI